ncbi:MAG: hypothetical protein AAGM46_26025, partial [Cyanobacteria bacterium J06582_2]
NVKSHQAKKYNSFTEGYGEVVTSPSGERPRVAARRKGMREIGVWGKAPPIWIFVFEDKFCTTEKGIESLYLIHIRR